ncbi:hypothetical protein [Nonomuraea sp. NPDC050540]
MAVTNIVLLALLGLQVVVLVLVVCGGRRAVRAWEAARRPTLSESPA